MSYCRFSKESDVYVYPTINKHHEYELVCCGCHLGKSRDHDFFDLPDYRVRKAQAMLSHLQEHRSSEQLVPESAIDRLKQEVKIKKRRN